ncbi:MAG: hypothetical protein IPK39_22880 [Sulfuritalea sp.]|nr:hypothetical protein [Sulfuritalea sp.]
MGIKTGTKVWAPGSALPPKPWAVAGDESPRACSAGPDNQPVTVKNLALSLPSSSAWRKTTWREGTSASLSSRFAAVLVRAAKKHIQASVPRDEEWLLIR